MDRGYWDGVRYPANSVINFVLPNFVRKGTSSILLQDYNPEDVASSNLIIYGALKVRPGTKVRIYAGIIGQSAWEESIVQGIIDFQTVRMQTTFQNSYNIGSPVVLSEVKEGLFDEDDVKSILRKFASTGSYHFIEYK